MENLNYLIAIVAGLGSFLTPCVLPMVPIYLAIISGVSIEEMKTGQKHSFKVIIAAVLFVLGVTTVFAMLGLAIGFLASTFFKSIINLVLGVLIIIFGLHYTGIIRIPLLYKEARFSSSGKSGFLRAYLVGFLFAFGWTPCVGPILGSILALPADKPLIKVSYMIVYAIGLGIPFLISAFAIKYFYKFFNKIKKHFHKIEVTIGIILIVLGGYYIYNVFQSGDLFKKQTQVVVTQNQRQSGANFKFINQNGVETSLNKINAKLYIINVWTTWCPNCIKEIPDLSKLATEFKKKGLFVLGICVEDSDSTKNEFIKLKIKFKASYINHFDSNGKIYKYLKAFYAPSSSISVYPVTYILDANRKVIKFIPGAKDYMSWKNVIVKNIE